MHRLYANTMAFYMRDMSILKFWCQSYSPETTPVVNNKNERVNSGITNMPLEETPWIKFLPTRLHHLCEFSKKYLSGYIAFL